MCSWITILEKIRVETIRHVGIQPLSTFVIILRNSILSIGMTNATDPMMMNYFADQVTTDPGTDLLEFDLIGRFQERIHV